MEFKIIFANGRQTFYDVENEKELQSAINKAKSIFGSEVSKVVPMDEEKFSVGGFLTGSVIGVALASLFGVEKKNLSRDRKFVNKKQGHEKSYSKGTGRTGYKGNAKFGKGGSAEQLYHITAYDKNMGKRRQVFMPDDRDFIEKMFEKQFSKPNPETSWLSDFKVEPFTKSKSEKKTKEPVVVEFKYFRTLKPNELGEKGFPFSISWDQDGGSVGLYNEDGLTKAQMMTAFKKAVGKADFDKNFSGYEKNKYALGGSLSKGDIYEEREVFSEIGSYNSEADARAVVERNNKFFTENDQPLVADVVSYSKKMGDRDVKIIKAVVFLKKEFKTGGKTASDEVYKEVYDYAIGGDRPSSLSSLKKQVDALAKRENLSVSQIYKDVKDAEASSSQFKTGGGVGSNNKMWSMQFYSTELVNPRKKQSYYIRRDVIEAPTRTKALNIAKKKHTDFRSLIFIEEVVFDKNGFLKSVTMPKKHSKGGLLGQSAKVEFLSEEFATEELINDLKEKSGITSNSTGDVPVIAFAYTDYGGSFLDKVAIQYFQENYPENIVTEVTGWGGENAFVFGEPAQEWMDSTEDYPLGFEDFEEFYMNKESEAEMEGFENFIDNELSTDEYVYDRDELLSWLGENRGGYFSVTTQGLDYSTDDLMEAVMESGLVAKMDGDEEFGKGGSTGKSLVVSYSSYFDYNKYDTDVISKVVSENGGKDVHLEKDQGMFNQPDVVVFKGDKNQIERALNDAFGTEYIRVSEKDWRTKKFDNGGGVDKNFVGGNLSEYELDELHSGITIKDLDKMLMSKFPDAFGFEIYEAKSTTEWRNLTPEMKPYGGLKDANLKVYFDKSHSLHYNLYQGGENTYFRFPLEGNDNKGYIGMFGFKDQGDVPKEYVTSFVALLHKIYGQPFKVNHEVYKTGGGVQKANVGLLLATQMMANRQQRMADPNYRSRYEDRGLDGKVVLPEGRGYASPMQPIQPPMNYAQPPMPMYAKGGAIGQEITFRHWSGDTKHGTIVEIFPDGSLDVSCGFGHCLVSPSEVITGAEKMARGSKIDEFNDIMENNVITEKQVNLIKTRLNSGALKRDAEIVQYIWDNTPDLTPEQNQKGIEFLMNLYKTPTGKERSNHVFGYREMDALDNFGHFALAGFHDASRYGQRPYYIPMYDVYTKDGEYGFQYYYDGKMNIVGGKGMKVTGDNLRETYSDWKQRNAIRVEKEDDLYIAVDGNGYKLMKAKNKEELSKMMKNLYMFSKHEGGQQETMYAKGGSAGRTNDRNHVNKAQSHEVRYARSHEERTGYKGNTRFAGGGTIDNDAVRELQLFLENDGQLYAQRIVPIQKNLMTKLAQGKYDHEMAQKLFMYLVQDADKKYQKEFGSSTSGYMLSMASRKELCKILEEEFYSMAKDGEFDHLIPKKYSGSEIKFKTGGTAGSGKEPYSKSSFSKTDWQKISSFLKNKYTETEADQILNSRLMRMTGGDNYTSFVKFYNQYESEFDKVAKEKFSKGGSAGNPNLEEVWNSWSASQREHFLSDHMVLSNKAEDKRASLYRFDELPIDLVNAIKSVLKKHISEGKYGKGGSAGNPKKPIEFKSSNLLYHGKGKDLKGQRVVRISFPSGRAWSIQTNGNLPKTHSDGYDEKEINQFVKEFGSDAQKKRLKIYK